MEAMTLEQLKAQNANVDSEQDQETATDTDELEIEAAEEEELEGDQNADSDGGEGGESDVEDWMQSDEQGSQSGDQFVPVAKHAEIRSKLKGKIGEQASEIEQLRAEIEALKGGVKQPAATGKLPPRPRLDDFETEEDHAAALDDWYDLRQETREREKTQAQTVNQYRDNLAKSVDQHYERAAKLAEQSGIAPELYKQSDLAVRTVIDKIRPGQGDLITDQLISTLGEGSEKVMYYLGRNQTAQAQLQSALIEDPTGMKAIAFLGRKAAELSSPRKKLSRAPKPPADVNGDANHGDSGRKLKKEYADAHKRGDHQAAYNAKKRAKQLKLDVSNW